MIIIDTYINLSFFYIHSEIHTAFALNHLIIIEKCMLYLKRCELQTIDSELGTKMGRKSCQGIELTSKGKCLKAFC